MIETFKSGLARQLMTQLARESLRLVDSKIENLEGFENCENLWPLFIYITE